MIGVVMEKLALTPCPKPKPMGEDFFIAALVLAVALFFLWGISRYPGMRGFLEAMLGIDCFAALAFGISFLDDWFYNRDYPEMLQKHLGSPLSAKDYEQLARFARRYPELQSWIAAVMDAEGQILYRDAGPLQNKINRYLETVPQKVLRDVVHPGQPKPS